MEQEGKNKKRIIETPRSDGTFKNKNSEKLVHCHKSAGNSCLFEPLTLIRTESKLMPVTSE